MTKLAVVTTEQPPAASPGALPATLPQQYLCCELEFERSARAAGDEGAEEEVITVTISTETPHKRRWGVEILSHEESAIDMSLARKGLSLLLEHGGEFDPYSGTAGRILPGHHLGFVDNIRVKSKKLVGDAHFEDSPHAQEVKRGVLSQPPTRRFVSVGWLPILAKQTKVAKEPGQINEFIWTRWKPVEVSVVSIPADPNAGVAARSDGGATFPVAIEGATSAQEEKETMKLNPKMDGEPGGGGTQARGGAAAEPPAPTAVVEVVDSKAFAKFAGEIMRTCRASGIPPEIGESIIARGLTLDQAKAELFDHRANASGNGTVLSPPSAEQITSAMSPKEKREYRITDAINTAINVVERREARGVALDVHNALSSIYTPQNAGAFLVPMTLSNVKNDERFARAMGTGVAGGGAEVVFDQPGELIDIFKAESPLGKLGAVFLPGLTSPIQFPRVTSEPTAYHVGENPGVGVTRSQTNFDTVTLSPRTLQSEVVLPRQLLQMASLDMENDTKQRMGRQHGLAIARGVVMGVGGQHQPLGIMNLDDVQPFDMEGVPDYAHYVDMSGLVADQDAEFGRLGWLMTTGLSTVAKRTLEFEAAGSKAIWTGPRDNGMVADYKAVASTLMPKTLGAGSEHGCIYGKWDEVNVGLFGIIELIVNPFLLASYGQVVLHTFQMYDGLVKRPQAFVVAEGALIA